MKSIVATLVLILAAAAAFGVPLTASWIEGKVECGSGSSWKPVNIGDKVDSALSVKLAAGAMAEFSEGSRRVSLSSPGVYSLDALVKAGAEQAKKRSGAMGKLGKLVDPKAADQATTVAGVRGAAQDESETMWMTEDEEGESLAEEAKSYAREGRFADAATFFGQAAAASEGDEAEGYLYAMSWSLAAGGSTIEAIKTLRAFDPEGAEWRAQRDLLLARLDLDSGSAAEARTILEALLAEGTLTGDDLVLAKEMLEEAKAVK